MALLSKFPTKRGLQGRGVLCPLPRGVRVNCPARSDSPGRVSEKRKVRRKERGTPQVRLSGGTNREHPCARKCLSSQSPIPKLLPFRRRLQGQYSCPCVLGGGRSRERQKKNLRRPRFWIMLLDQLSELLGEGVVVAPLFGSPARVGAASEELDGEAPGSFAGSRG